MKNENKFLNEKFYHFNDLTINETQLMIETCLKFFTNHFSSTTFLRSLIMYETKNDEKEQNYLSELAIQLIHLSANNYVYALKSLNEINSFNGYISELFGKVEQLLTSKSYVSILKNNLLIDTDESVRHISYQLLNTRLTNETPQVLNKIMDEHENYIKLVPVIAKLLKPKKNLSDTSRQDCIVSLDLLARRFAKLNTAPFLKIVGNIFWQFENSKNSSVIGSCAITIATKP
jgi:hypothetical protein